MPLQAMVGAAQLLMRIVRSACFCIHAAFIQEGFVPHQPVMQALDKAVFAATRQRQRKRPQLACRLTFRLFGQVADDDLDLVKLAHLHQNTGEGLQQPAASVADNALYHNASFLQRCDLLSVALNRLVLDFEHRQRPLADRVIQHHDAPFSAEIGGVHDEVNCRLRGHAGRFRDCFGKMAADSFEAASMLLCKLCGGLLAVAVKLPEGVRVKSAAAAETLVASGTFVALFAITGTVLLDLF